MLCLARKPHKRGDRGVDWALQLGNCRSDRWTAAEGFQVIWEPTAHALVRLMTILASHHGTNHHRLVHPLGQLRKDFADLDSGDIGRNRAELTPDL